MGLLFLCFVLVMFITVFGPFCVLGSAQPLSISPTLAEIFLTLMRSHQCFAVDSKMQHRLFALSELPLPHHMHFIVTLSSKEKYIFFKCSRDT